MKDDAELLRLYARDHSEDAFAELVRRHLNLVYSAALRQVNGDTHLASDAAQLVFVDLARKARVLTGHRLLTGWLFTSTRFAAAKLVRAEQRRRQRERNSDTMHATETGGREAWEQISPVLDEALASLNTTDRDALLLRYFEGRGYAAIGSQLRLSENAARMRVERALDKLRARLARHGLTSTSAALGTTLAAYGVAGAPPALGATITGAAVASGGAAALSLVSLMSLPKLPTLAAASIVAVGGAGILIQANAHADLRAELERLRKVPVQGALPSVESDHLVTIDEKLAAELADLRRDDGEFARLAAEADALRAKFAQSKAAAQTIATRQVPSPAYDVRNLDSLPSPRFQARPVYPFNLRRLGYGGEVAVDFIVDREGNVHDAKPRTAKIITGNGEFRRSDVTGATAPDSSARTVQLSKFVVTGQGSSSSSSTPVDAAMFDELEKAAIEAVSKWKFRAGLKGGKEVNTRLTIPIVFNAAPATPSAASTAAATWF